MVGRGSGDWCRSVDGMCVNCFSKLDVVIGQVAGAAIVLKRPVQNVLAELGIVAPYDELGELAHTVSFLRSLDLDPVEILGPDAVHAAGTWTTAPSRKKFATWVAPGATQSPNFV